MSARPEVQLGEIVNALVKWRGKVAAVADELKMRRKSLYERIERAHLDLAAFRNIEPGKVEAMTRMTRMGGYMSRIGVAVPKPDAAPFTQPPARPSVDIVQTAALKAGEIPIKTAPRREPPIRIAPPQREILQRAAWDLQAHFQASTDVNLVLEQFIEEAFEFWLRSKLDAKPKRVRKGESGDPA